MALNRIDFIPTNSEGTESDYRSMLILSANFESRLSVFYSNFIDNGHNGIDVIKPLEVNKDDLKTAINGLEDIMYSNLIYFIFDYYEVVYCFILLC